MTLCFLLRISHTLQLMPRSAHLQFSASPLSANRYGSTVVLYLDRCTRCQGIGRRIPVAAYFFLFLLSIPSYALLRIHFFVLFSLLHVVLLCSIFWVSKCVTYYFILGAYFSNRISIPARRQETVCCVSAT